MGRRQSLVRGNSRREALEIGWNGILLFRKPTKKEKKKKEKKKTPNHQTPQLCSL